MNLWVLFVRSQEQESMFLEYTLQRNTSAGRVEARNTVYDNQET